MRVAILAMLLCAAALAAHATTPFVRQIECPVGGERFSFTDTASSSSFGQRPDGKPYSNWDYPLPVCPGNGLPVYREFTSEELARLPSILGSAEFAEVRALAQPYYAASYIERVLAPDTLTPTWLLLQASWWVDENPDLKMRFQQEFVAAAQGVSPDLSNEESVVLRLRMANALRELSRFDEAEAALSTLSGATIEGAEDLADYVEILRRVNARRDVSAEPLDAIPRRIAAYLCLEHEREPGWDPQGLCGEGDLGAEVERIRAEE